MSMFGPITFGIPWRASTMKDVTRILTAIEHGEPRASVRLLPLVYDEWRSWPPWLAQEKPGQTLQPTALVHEAYLRLVDSKVPSVAGTAAATSSPPWRRPCDASSSHLGHVVNVSERHGGGRLRCELWISDRVTEPDYDDLLDLDHALVKLSQIHEQAAELVKLRVFPWMTVEEVAGTIPGDLAPHCETNLGVCSGLAHEGDGAGFRPGLAIDSRENWPRLVR